MNSQIPYPQFLKQSQANIISYYNNKEKEKLQKLLNQDLTINDLCQILFFDIDQQQPLYSTINNINIINGINDLYSYLIRKNLNELAIALFKRLEELNNFYLNCNNYQQTQIKWYLKALIKLISPLELRNILQNHIFNKKIKTKIKNISPLIYEEIIDNLNPYLTQIIDLINKTNNQLRKQYLMKLSYLHNDNQISSKEYEEILEKWINDPKTYIRQYIARYGTEYIKSQLINDKHYLVRKAIAQTTNDSNKIETLFNDVKDVVKRCAIKNKTTLT